MADLSSLIERIEAATWPDRRLNADVLLALGWAGDASGAFDPNGHRARTIPNYVGSIDDAMTLVPAGWWHGYMSSEAGFDAHCFEQVIDSPIFRATAATPALALVAAALKAREALL